MSCLYVISSGRVYPKSCDFRQLSSLSYLAVPSTFITIMLSNLIPDSTDIVLTFGEPIWTLDENGPLILLQAAQTPRSTPILHFGTGSAFE